jgi:hypothetical protein
MAATEHPLKQQLRALLRAQPPLEQLAAQTYAAFDRVADTWGRCTRAHAAIGQHWQPVQEQIEALQAASLHVLPDGRRPIALVKQAERMVKGLLQLIQQLIEQRKAPASAAPAPVNG